jgi:hypothetical protein
VDPNVELFIYYQLTTVEVLLLYTLFKKMPTSLKNEIIQKVKKHVHQQYQMEFIDEKGDMIIDFNTAGRLHNAILLSVTIESVNKRYTKYLPTTSYLNLTKENLDCFVTQCAILDDFRKKTDSCFHFMLPEPNTTYDDKKFKSDLLLVKNLTIKKRNPDVRGRIPMCTKQHCGSNTSLTSDQIKRATGKFEGHVDNMRVEEGFLQFNVESFVFTEISFSVKIPMLDIKRIEEQEEQSTFI